MAASNRFRLLASIVRNNSASFWNN